MAGLRYPRVLVLMLLLLETCVLTFSQETYDDDRISKMDQKLDQLLSMVEDLHINTYEHEGHIEALISGPRFNVHDSDFQASSSYDARHGTKCSRLKTKKPSDCQSSGWHAKGSDSTPWIQVDLGSTFDIHTVATQGRQEMNQWTLTYRIAYLDVMDFVFYQDRTHGGPKTFNGNTDRSTVVKNAFDPPFRARIVSLYPITWLGYGTIRWELYGKQAP